MTSFPKLTKKLMIILIAAAGMSASYMISSAPHMIPITYATRISKKASQHRALLSAARKIGRRQAAKGTLQLSQPLGVEDSRHGDQKVITIPKGQVLHYQKQNDGYIVWNKKYPNNSEHQYDANSSLSKQLIAHDAKDHNVPQRQNKNKGVPNIYKANAKKRAQQQAQDKAKMQRAQPKLPRTSDRGFNTGVIFAAIIGIIITGPMLLDKALKHLFDYRK